jgi:hypothetical protein
VSTPLKAFTQAIPLSNVATKRFDAIVLWNVRRIASQRPDLHPRSA